MRTVDQYKSWLLPVFKRNKNWRDLVEALINELITLQKTNMGSYNAVGFSSDKESIDLSIEGQWQCVNWLTSIVSKGYYDFSTYGFFQDNENIKLLYDNNSLKVIFAALFSYSFVIGKRYEIDFDVNNITGTDLGSLDFSIGGEVSTQVLSGSSVHVTATIEAVDSYFCFIFNPNAATRVTFNIENLVIKGVEDDIDDDKRWLLLKKHLDYDEADRFILERLRDSRSFPSISNLPLEVLRSFLKGYNDFIAAQGSGLGEIILFYFLGFSAEVLDLYAFKGDYESLVYPYVQQQKDELLISTYPNYYAQVLTSGFNQMYIDLKPGHQVGVGDELSNQNHAFSNSTVVVVYIVGNRAYVDMQVTIYANDVLDIYRKYKYAVNPDPTNYFKTSHVDVYFKTKYIEGVLVDFSFLEEAFYKYVPINTVVRFFGYNNAIEEQRFKLVESVFSFVPIIEHGTGLTTLTFSEVVPVIPDDVTYVVTDLLPENDIDINGTPVDGYSYALHYMHPTDYKQHTYIRI